MRKILLFFLLLAFFSLPFLSCSSFLDLFQSRSWYNNDYANYPTTSVSKYRINNGFIFPEGTHVYNIMTSLDFDSLTCNKTSVTKSLSYNNGNCSNIKMSYSKEGTIETRTITVKVKEKQTVFDEEKNMDTEITVEKDYSYTFIFDKYDGIIKDETSKQQLELLK